MNFRQRRTPRLPVIKKGWILLLPLLLSGCVYLRLLQVKRQLSDFEDNFDLGGRAEWVVTFKNPTLFEKDAVFLVGSEPLSSWMEGEEKILHWEFELVGGSNIPPPPLAHLSVNVATKNRRVTRLIVPEKFLLFFSRGVLSSSLRQAANADVHEWSRRVNARLEFPPELESELPSQDRALMLLGPPRETITPQAPLENTPTQISGDKAEISASNLPDTWEQGVYHFRILKDDFPETITARLWFSPDRLLRRIAITWDRSTVDAEFLRH